MNNLNQSSEVKTKNITLSAILGWLFGIVFLISGITTIFSKPFQGILLLAMGAIVFPPLVNITKEKLHLILSRNVKIIAIVVLLGVFSSTLPKSDVSTNPTTSKEAVETTQPSISISKEVKTAQASVPQKVVQPTIATYQQIFSFSGNGAKKSEPFTIKGSRFKIKYDCSGDLCQAFLHNINKSFDVSIIMNGQGPLKDETIIYGSGEYYIEANTIGSYSMVVEDYR